MQNRLRGKTSLDCQQATAGYALEYYHSTAVYACFTTCVTGYSSDALSEEGVKVFLPEFIPRPISISLWYLPFELFSRPGPLPTESRKVARIFCC